VRSGAMLSCWSWTLTALPQARANGAGSTSRLHGDDRMDVAFLHVEARRRWTETAGVKVQCGMARVRGMVFHRAYSALLPGFSALQEEVHSRKEFSALKDEVDALRRGLVAVRADHFAFSERDPKWPAAISRGLQTRLSERYRLPR